MKCAQHPRYETMPFCPDCRTAEERARPARRGDWMQTATGRQFWPLDPRPEEVDILDIAAALSKLCRYGGHCHWHYSVAQHSIYVSHQLPPELALAGLLHDATEAYCVDVPRPLKRHLAGYAEIEHGIWLAIAERFDLPTELPPEVHAADNAVLLAEKAQIMLPSPQPWDVPGVAAPVKVSCWTPEQAREAFLSRFALLLKHNAGRAACGNTPYDEGPFTLAPACWRCNGTGKVGDDPQGQCSACNPPPGVPVSPAPSDRSVWTLDEEQRLYEALAKRAAARAALGAPAVPAPGHSWHDYGQQNGRNRSWCSRCKLVVWTGEEPDTPCVSMPTVGVDLPDAGKR